jgi:hypothetical protein
MAKKAFKNFYFTGTRDEYKLRKNIDIPRRHAIHLLFRRCIELCGGWELKDGKESRVYLGEDGYLSLSLQMENFEQVGFANRADPYLAPFNAADVSNFDDLKPVEWAMMGKAFLNQVDKSWQRIFAFYGLKRVDEALEGFSNGTFSESSVHDLVLAGWHQTFASESRYLDVVTRNPSYSEELFVDRISAIAKERAVARHSKDPKQKEKRYVMDCWEAWRKDPTRYASKAAFARDMLDKSEHLASTKVIEDWVRDWEANFKKA